MVLMLLQFPIFFQKALAGESLTIFGDGGATRDFIFVKDIVAALAFLLKNESVCGVFNAGYGRQTSILRLANLFLSWQAQIRGSFMLRRASW